MKLKLKKWPHYRNYEIVSDGVRFEFKTYDGFSSQTIKFEEIGFDEQIFDQKPSPIKTGLAVSVMFNIILFFLAFGDDFINMKGSMNYSVAIAIPIITIVFGKFYFKIEKLKFIVGQKNIAFWYNNKFKNEVDTFITEIKNRKRQYIRNKFLNIDEHEDSMTIKYRLNWLKTEGYIDEAEFKDWLSQINNRTIIKGF